ncbi:GntR family transcriptional regulator [Cupriavidus sp. AU9028]|uniref:GntR family transcriptional regulator n=1 Tax=Cupriavidus sp. AU9028 TaxID=2871157 RepID=UPI001C94446C|nr:GntR family transcriptional regulator [Cupriavidus sp. AU9028]MBY4896907.1 GntR family transcriptional regulator [Cupriavidus sp. AU9028]
MPDPLSALLARSRQPVYLQLATILRRRIERAEWREGERIPSLDALCREYGVARMTMHHALSVLDGEGLLQRSRGRGTFVSASRPARKPLRLPVTWDEAIEVGERLGTEALLEPGQTVSLPQDLGMPCDARRAPAYRFLRRLHRVDGRPFAFGEVYIEDELFAREPGAFRQGATVPVLDRLAGVRIGAARQRLSILTAGADSAAALELPVGAPVAELRRFACVDDRLVYFARIEFPTEFVCLDFDLLAPRGRATPSNHHPDTKD